MRFAVFGAGAIGGMLAHGLARAGEDVAVVARGAHLAAIRDRGLAVERGGEVSRVEIAATDDARDLGPADVVVIALKAHAVPGAAAAIAPLVGPRTTIVTAMNGIPYWYFHGLPGGAGQRVEAVDPGGVVSAALPPAQALGCVVYPAAELAEPGLVAVMSGDRFTLGEPSGENTQRATAIAAAFRRAGFKAPLKPRIRDEIWMKLWGNVSFNPLSALTGETLDQLANRPELVAIVRTMMAEAQAVGEAHGARFAIDIEKRIDGARAVGAHKTSMLQDLERGRPMEIDALVGAVCELGRSAGIATPMIDTVHALITARARTLGLTPAR